MRLDVFDIWYQTYPEDIAASAPDDVWIAGQQQDVGFGVVWHFDGTRCRTMLSPPDHEYGSIDGVVPLGPNDAWVAVGAGEVQPDAQILHWNGSRWQDRTPAVQGEAGFELIGATSPTSVWAIVYAQTETYLVMRSTWNGWTQVNVPNVCSSGRHSEWHDVEVGPRDAYLTGACVKDNEKYLLTLHWNGSTWTRV